MPSVRKSSVPIKLGVRSLEEGGAVALLRIRQLRLTTLEGSISYNNYHKGFATSRTGVQKL